MPSTLAQVKQLFQQLDALPSRTNGKNAKKYHRHWLDYINKVSLLADRYYCDDGHPTVFAIQSANGVNVCCYRWEPEDAIIDAQSGWPGNALGVHPNSDDSEVCEFHRARTGSTNASSLNSFSAMSSISTANEELAAEPVGDQVSNYGNSQVDRAGHETSYHRDPMVLASPNWKPVDWTKVKGAIFLIHGITAHSRFTLLKLRGLHQVVDIDSREDITPAEQRALLAAARGGMIEHDAFDGSWLAALTERGYVVYAIDLQGHGLSSAWEGSRCNVDQFDSFHQDVMQFLQGFMRRGEITPNTPLFLAGWSMGGSVAVRLCEVGFRTGDLILLDDALTNQTTIGSPRDSPEFATPPFVPSLSEDDVSEAGSSGKMVKSSSPPSIGNFADESTRPDGCARNCPVRDNRNDRRLTSDVTASGQQVSSHVVRRQSQAGNLVNAQRGSNYLQASAATGRNRFLSWVMFGKNDRNAPEYMRDPDLDDDDFGTLLASADNNSDDSQDDWNQGHFDSSSHLFAMNNGLGNLSRGAETTPVSSPNSREEYPFQLPKRPGSQGIARIPIAGLILIAPGLSAERLKKKPLNRLLFSVGSIVSDFSPLFRAAQLEPNQMFPFINEVCRRDPLCYFGSIAARISWEALCAMDRVAADRNDLPPQLPLFLIHPANDTMADPEGSRQFLKTIAIQDQESHFPVKGWHFLSKEPGCLHRLRLILDWMDGHL